jgi:hypothetical protein
LEPAGLAAFLAASLWLTPDTPWPGLAALLPVAGAVLVLLDSGGRTLLLGSAALQGIGCWSYSIYLWHWPLVVWLLQSRSRQDGAWIAAGMAASVLLGWLSFRLVENPARRFVNRFRLAPALARERGHGAGALRRRRRPPLPERARDDAALQGSSAPGGRARPGNVLQGRYFGELYKPLYREGSCFLVAGKVPSTASRRNAPASAPASCCGATPTRRTCGRA